MSKANKEMSEAFHEHENAEPVHSQKMTQPLDPSTLHFLANHYTKGNNSLYS